MHRLIDIKSMCRPAPTPTLTLPSPGAPEPRSRTGEERRREEGRGLVVLEEARRRQRWSEGMLKFRDGLATASRWREPSGTAPSYKYTDRQDASTAASLIAQASDGCRLPIQGLAISMVVISQSVASLSPCTVMAWTEQVYLGRYGTVSVPRGCVAQ